MITRDLSSLASKHDVDMMKDRVHLLAQSSVSAALSGWTEVNESKLRSLERDIALVKLGQSQAVQKEMAELVDSTVGDGPGTALTADVVSRVMNTATPSESLVKGMVASEILQLRSQLEDKVGF
jgi:hypothetical protein